jgi:hypothetical protein
MQQRTLHLHTVPGPATWARLVSVLHARHVDVVELSYREAGDRASFCVTVRQDAASVQQLARHLDRAVDVLGCTQAGSRAVASAVQPALRRGRVAG